MMFCCSKVTFFSVLKRWTIETVEFGEFSVFVAVVIKSEQDFTSVSMLIHDFVAMVFHTVHAWDRGLNLENHTTNMCEVSARNVRFTCLDICGICIECRRGGVYGKLPVENVYKFSRKSAINEKSTSRVAVVCDSAGVCVCVCM